MWPWTADTPGWVYLFHFHRRLGNLRNPRAQAQHYVGFAEDLEARLAEHRAGRGAKIVAAAVERGIDFTIFSWPACLAVEKQIKRRKETRVFCPICCADRGVRPRPLPTAATQHTLPLDDDFPAPPPARAGHDAYELRYYRRMRAARIIVARTDDWDDGLL